MSSEKSLEPPAKKSKIDNLTQLHAVTVANTRTSVIFSPSYSAREFKLFELSAELTKSVEEGQDLQIIGKKGGEAVLCSQTMTYTMKRVETSNCVLFVPPSSTSTFTVTSSASDYFELVQVPGRLDQLRALLSTAVYPAADETSYLCFSLKEILERVQASRKEIIAALVSMEALEVEGKVRVICETAQRDTLQALLQILVEKQWKTADDAQLKETDCLEALKEAQLSADPVVVQAVLRSLSSTVAAAGPGGEALPAFGTPSTWTLDPLKIASATAHMVFQQRYKDCQGTSTSSSASPASASGVRMGRVDFLSEWSLVAPSDCLAPSSSTGSSAQDVEAAVLALLADGIAVSCAEAGGAVLTYLPVCAMRALGAKERLSQLFAAKKTLTLQELQPYMAGLYGTGATGTPKTLTELLALHTRCVEEEGKQQDCLYYSLK